MEVGFWEPDLKTPEGIEEAVKILGWPVVMQLAEIKPSNFYGYEVANIDMENKVVTIREVKK